MPNELEGPRIPDVLLEQYRLNELAPEDADRVREALAADSGLRARLLAIEHSDEELRRAYPPEWMADRIRERIRQHPVGGPARKATLRGWAVPLALTAAAATFAVAIAGIIPTAGLSSGPGNPDSADDGNRVKGLRPSLVVYRKSDRGSETLADGALARPGDVVRLGYVPANRTHGVIVSIDTRGTVTLHLPASGTRAVPLAHARMNLLDTAYELDDVPGWERFYFVTADTAFDIAPVVEAIRRSAVAGQGIRADALPLPAEYDQFVFLLQKEVRP